MRPISWYDWPYFLRRRHEIVCLDNVLLITQGEPLSLTHFLFAIRPTDHQFTAVFEAAGHTEKGIAQVYQSAKMSSAHISYLFQPEIHDGQDLAIVLDELVKQAGHWAAKQVVADLDINSPYFAGFRQAGFSVLAKQKVFECPPIERMPANSSQPWRIWNTTDIHAMRHLYHTLVPPLVQPVEPMTRRETLGLVYYDQNDNLQAYADLVFGLAGVWIMPVIHPQVKVDIAEVLQQLLQALPNLNGRPVFMTTRSYQPWVEHALLDLSANPGPEQALLVRYMALRQKVVTEFNFAAIENGNREPTLPLAPIKHQRS